MKKWFSKLLVITLVLVCFNNKTNAQTVTVNSLTELKTYLAQDKVDVKLTPGTYNITTSNASSYGAYETIGTGTYYTLFKFSGDNCTYDFTDVIINIETGVFRLFGNNDVYEMRIAGNNNTLKNLTLEDIGSVHDNPRRGALSMAIDGQNNIVDGFHVTAKGSLPYGYGDIFGKGSGSMTPLDKHSGILIRGDYNTLKNTTMIHRAFGHCVFMQAANHPTIDGCYIEGETRTTNYILDEKGSGSIADNLDFMTTWGYKLPSGFMLALCEAGIRSYNAGTTTIDGISYQRGSNDITIKNTTVKNTRSGCTISQSSGQNYVENVTLIGNENGFAIGRGIVKNCYADAAYGPAFNGGAGIIGDVTLIAPENGYYNGTNCIASTTGGTFTLNSAVEEIPSNMSIQMGSYRSFRHQEGSNLLYQVTTDFSGAILNNNTGAKVDLGPGSNNNTVNTCGEFNDDGTGNTIVNCGEVIVDEDAPNCDNGFDAFETIQAESFCDQIGVQNEGSNIGFIENGDWIKFNNLDFASGAESFNVKASSKTLGGSIELRLGSPTGVIVGTSNISSTGNWSSYISVSCPINGASGVQDLYLVFTGESGYLFNIDSFEFTPSSLSTNDILESKVAVYPNPVSDILTLKLDSNLVLVHIDIADVTGKIILSKNIEEDTQINLSKLTSGFYSVKFSSETGDSYTKKIIKL